jgi:chromosome partitioning protein
MKNGTLTAHQFAEALGVSKKTLFEYEKEGKLPPAKRRLQGSIAYRYYTAEDLLEARKHLRLPPLLPSKRRQLFMNLKGGVGKTVIAANYSYCLAQYGIKTLAIDLDAQAHLTSCLGLKPETFEVTLFTVLIDGAPVQSAIKPTSLPTLDIVPSNLTLSPVELLLFQKHMREFRLRQALEQIHGDYDVIVMDAPPNLSLLNLNAILAAQDLIVPVMADFLSYDGLRLFFENLEMIKEDFSYELENVFIVLNGFNASETVCKDAKAALEKNYGDYLLKTIIRKNTAITRSTAYHQSIFEYDPSSKGAKDIESLVREVLNF